MSVAHAKLYPYIINERNLVRMENHKGYIFANASGPDQYKDLCNLFNEWRPSITASAILYLFDEHSLRIMGGRAPGKEHNKYCSRKRIGWNWIKYIPMTGTGSSANRPEIFISTFVTNPVNR